MFACRSRPDVGQWLSSLPTDEADHAARFAVELATTIVVEHDGTFLGTLMLRVTDARAQAEVALEAKGTQAELGVRRIEAACFVENVAGRRVTEKTGLRQERYYVRESRHRDGTWRDGMSFALLAAEWPVSRGARRRTSPR